MHIIEDDYICYEMGFTTLVKSAKVKNRIYPFIDSYNN